MAQVHFAGAWMMLTGGLQLILGAGFIAAATPMIFGDGEVLGWILFTPAWSLWILAFAVAIALGVFLFAQGLKSIREGGRARRFR